MGEVNSRLRRCFRGSLIGAAVGDARGAALEGLPPRERRVEDAEAQPFSRYTDDTAMTIVVAEWLVDRGGADPDNLAQRFAEAYRREPWRGYGPGPPMIFRQMAAGVPAQEAAQSLYRGEGSLGNGAAMRVAPAGLFAFDQPGLVADLARTSALVTHTHPVGVDGAVLQASTVAALLRRSGSDSVQLSSLLGEIGNLTRTRMFDEALANLASLSNDASVSEVIRELGNGIEAHRSVPTAIYAFSRHSDSFPGAISYAIGLGGDTDTIASMAGALAGAWLGEDAIPKAWRRGTEGTARLRDLADQLFELAVNRP